jgi:hypothetical protein
MCGAYRVTLNDLKAVLKASNSAGQNKSQKAIGENPTQKTVQDVWRRKRQSTDDTARTPKNVAVQIKTSSAINTPHKGVANRNISPPSGKWIWTWILPMPRTFHARQSLAKQIGRPNNPNVCH